jgi:hypothetical protein
MQVRGDVRDVRGSVLLLLDTVELSVLLCDHRAL